MSEEAALVEEPQIQDQEVAKENNAQEQLKSVDRNWEEAREALRIQKQRIEELEAKLSQQQKASAPNIDEDEFSKLDPEDFLTVGKAKEISAKLSAKEAKKAASQVIQEYIQQQNIANDETRMRSKYQDFDYVIENFAVPMIKNDPALAYKIQTSKNPAETAYKLGKLSDEYETTMTKQIQSPRAEKILKNSQRPTSANAVSSPLKNQADEFSKLSSQQVWEMSQKFARGA